MVTGMGAVLDLTSDSCPMSSWWQFKNVGSCRQYALLTNFITYPWQLACADYWQGQAVGAVSAYISAVDGNFRRARIVISGSMPGQYAGPISAGTEYYAFNLVIRNSNTLGAGACTGCSDPVCIMFQEFLIEQPAGTPGESARLTNPLASSYATWQGGTNDCFCADCSPAPCTTPTLNRTWGQIKSLYR